MLLGFPFSFWYYEEYVQGAQECDGGTDVVCPVETDGDGQGAVVAQQEETTQPHPGYQETGCEASNLWIIWNGFK